jgi:AbrB family looped-hinge helix DNA binding protein
MDASIVTVSSKGQIVIPAGIRRTYGIDAGTKLSVVDMGDHISLVPAPVDAITELRGILKDSGYTMEDFLAERRRDRAAEDESAKRWKR